MKYISSTTNDDKVMFSGRCCNARHVWEMRNKSQFRAIFYHGIHIFISYNNRVQYTDHMLLKYNIYRYNWRLKSRSKLIFDLSNLSKEIGIF